MHDVRALLAENLPDLVVHTVRILGEGWDNVAYEVNGDLVVRCHKEGRQRVVADEFHLLEIVSAVSPLPVPEPLFLGDGCMGYRKVPGTALLDLPRDERTAAVGAPLGRFLRALHDVPIDRVADLVTIDADPLDQWVAEAIPDYEAVADRIDPARRPAIDAFLAAPPPPGPPALVFSHNDLGVEHVLVDPATLAVTGVIDWTDAAVCDPAYDFALLYRDLGPAVLDAAITGHGAVDPGLRDRAVFYARVDVFSDIKYGLDLGKDRYVSKSLDSLRRLFAAR